MPTWTSQQIAERVGGELAGPGDLMLSGVEQLDQAEIAHLTFIGDAAHAQRWPQSRASAALVSRGLELADVPGRAVIRVGNADLAMASALELFAPPMPSAGLPEAGVHPLACVDPTAQLGEGVRVGAFALIGPRVVVGRNSVIHARVTIMDDSRLGSDCVIWPGTVIRERCVLGDRCQLHPNVTIGADGFGYRPAADGRSLVKIPHIGNVIIGNDVEIGAGTCVDRGKFSATTIGDGGKIDNLCQIAHNCRIGRSLVMAGQCGLAGSISVGDGVMMGGGVSIKDHVTIGSGVRIAARAAVMDDIPAGETWGGYPAQEMRRCLREVAAVRKLPDLVKAFKPK